MRAHLVGIRGGAPFLSPSDGVLLDDWLDQGVSVSVILCAIERCAESRRKRASRLPITLTAARRHLGKPGRVVKAVVKQRREGDPRLEPIARKLDELNTDMALQAAESMRRVEADELDRCLPRALEIMRVYLEACWHALPRDEQERRAGEFLEILEVDPDEPPGSGYGVAVAMAKERLRNQWPWLNAATIRELLA